MNIKEIKNFADLYGWSITVIELKKLYSLVSWAKGSTPTGGSLTLPTKSLKENNYTTIKRVILHKNKNLTLVTNSGWMRFYV